MTKIIKKNILPLYKNKENKIVSYGWCASPPFITKDKIKYEKYYIKNKKNLYENKNFGQFSKP
jgi:fructose-1,6-bisphosphatase